MGRESLDIDKELEQIIEKYNLDRHYPAYRTSRRACDFLEKWVRRLAEGKEKILFLGMDEHALKLIDGWARAGNINTLFIESLKELEKDTGGYLEELQRADKVFVVSYTRTIEILHWLWRHGFQAESLYDILENERIYLQMEFYRFFTPVKMTPELELYENIEVKSIDGSSLVLYEYYFQKQRLQYGASIKDIKRIREKLFFLAMCMRNFLEMKKILDMMKEAVDFKQCWDEVQELFMKVKHALQMKKQNNIIIYWLDMLPYEEAEKMKYLQSKRIHSLYFHNAYTVTPYTNPVCKSMFCNIRQVDDLGYREEHISMDNSVLLREILNSGYQFNLLSDYLKKMFASEHSHCVGLTKRATSSEVFWNLLGQILYGEEKTVYLVHTLMELHAPMLSVRRDRFEKQYMMGAREEQIQELDGQLCFYDSLLGDSFYRVYMSDHGYGDIRKKVHIHFQVYHASWKRQETEKMFCLLDFHKIMCQLLRGQEIDASMWEREFVPIQDVDYYDKGSLKEVLQGRRGIGLCFLTAYKGIVTKEGLYVRFKTGDEIFCKASEEWPKVPVFLSEEEKNSTYIRDMRKKAGGFPAELDSDPKFEHAKFTYRVYENIKNTIYVVAKLLNVKFSAYVDGGIALRTGGEHSWQIYELLTEANRKKIGCIIEKNKQCMCAKLGIPIFEPGKRLPDTMQAVLLSSKIYLEELKEEAKSLYGELDSIDIYQCWEQAGYHFSRDFWFGQDVDYEVGFPED
jgi:hypothetical protein